MHVLELLQPVSLLCSQTVSIAQRLPCSSIVTRPRLQTKKLKLLTKISLHPSRVCDGVEMLDERLDAHATGWEYFTGFAA